MTSSTRQILLLIAAVVGAIIVLGAALLFGTSLYQGNASIPESVQSSLWTAVVGLVVVVSTAISVYVNSRALTAGRQHSDINHMQTQYQVSALTEKVENGLPARTAEIVKESAATVAEELRRTNQEQALANLTAKLDALLSGQTPAATAITDPVVVAIEKNTAETAAAVTEIATKTEVGHD